MTVLVVSGILLALILMAIRAVWLFLRSLFVPETPPPGEALPTPRFAAPTVTPSRAPARTAAPSPSPPAAVFPPESEDLEIRVSLGAYHVLGRRLVVEIRGGPAPTVTEPLVYVVTGASLHQGKEYPLRLRPTDNLSSPTFSSVHTRTEVARLDEDWTLLTYLDVDAMYPARPGRQPYVFSCRVHRPGQEVGVGLPGPRGRAMEAASASAHFDLAEFGYLELHEWVKMHEDAVTTLARILYHAEVETEAKWQALSEWVWAQSPTGAPEVVKAYARKNLLHYYRVLREAPSTSSNRSMDLGKEASPDFQRELVALARGLVNAETADSAARKTYESLRGACWEALSTWVDRDKEPLPPRSRSESVEPVRPPVRPAPPKPAPPVRPPPSIPRVAPLPEPPPWEPVPAPPAGVAVDHGGERLLVLRDLLSIARVAAVLGFATTTWEQDKLLRKFLDRLVGTVRGEVARSMVRLELQAFLDEATSVIGRASHFKKRLDAAVAPIGPSLRASLGEAMRELILARSERSADVSALYAHGVKTLGWIPLTRAKPKPKPEPVVPPRPAAAPRPPVKPTPKAPLPARPPAKPAPAPWAPPPASGVPAPMTLAELMAEVGMPRGLDRAGQIAYLRTKFAELNNAMNKETMTHKRMAITRQLGCVGRLRHLLG